MAPANAAAAAAEGPRDFTTELSALGDRLAEAERYLGRDKLESRRAELEAEVAKPDLWDDQDNARSVTRELGRVTDDLGQLDGLRSTLDDARALLELTEESADVALSAELVETVDELGTRLGALELQSLFSGEYDEFDAVCEVHAGAGGTDAQDWTEMLLRMYQRWAERRGFTVEIDEATEGQEAGLLSATFIVRGRFAYGLLATERGVHRLVRMSPFDSQHRRQTSFASVEVTPFLEDAAEVEIDEKDLRVDTYRSSGAGGQHVNKTDSAVRLTHLPTGIVVAVQNERSQHQNKAKAMQILGAKLTERARAERQAELDGLSGERVDNAWGNQIRSYVMAPYQLVKDLRTNYETGNVDAVLDGDLDGFMEAELRRQRESGT
jgi:peptide chain release factor 2